MGEAVYLGAVGPSCASLRLSHLTVTELNGHSEG